MLNFENYSTPVGRNYCFASSCCVKFKERNSLKNRRKCLVGSEIISIFARFLCAMRPRVRVRCEDDLGAKVLRANDLRMQLSRNNNF